MDKAKVAALSKSKNAIVSAMTNVMFAAQHDIANTIVPELHQLCITQGATQLKDLKVDNHTSYSHHSSTKEFQQSMAEVVVDQLLGQVQNSGVFSIMLDESTDVSVHQNLMVYIRYLASVGGRVQPITRFLGIRQLSTANAESIFTVLVSMLESYGLPLDKLVGVSTDGASVMVGCKSGVVTRLREVTSGLLATHCIAHRLALGTGNAADKVRYLVKFQDVINSMYKYFAYSPKNMSRLEGIQAVLKDSKTRLQQVFHTRWLTFEGSVQAVVDNYSSLVSVFLEDNYAKALAMHKPITTYKFLYTAHYLADVLRHLAILCKSYQRSDIDFTEVNPLLLSTVEVLEGLRSGSGGNLSQFLNQVPETPEVDSVGLCTFEFKGHNIRDSAQQRSEASSACSQFVGLVIDNLRSRFTEEGDATVLRALTQLFDPSFYSQSDSFVLSEASSVVSDYLSSCGVGSKSDVEAELVNFQGYAKIQVAKNPHVYLGVRDLLQLSIRSKSTYPALAVAAERLLVAPVSTVDCERGFSKMNIIKTDLRNKLCIETLKNLMRLSLFTEPLDCGTAFDKWASTKARRILM
ncbi:zinc finger protein 862-like [Ostrea edulis]|uniref:zinc finger protein 862-like n=1 Tax=Ostrea edulis TaxID=37623 RepID=UPI0024AF7E37|nr:zinc finger protein 862-like [Ostrea edulis]